MPLWLTYSVLAACAASLIGGLWLGSETGRARAPRIARLAVLFQLGALVTAYLVLRPGAGDDPAEIRAAHAQSRPVFVDVYSNF